MSLNTKIIDGSGSNKSAEVVSNSRGNGLKVYTHDGIIKENSSRFYTNSVNGIEMNVNGAAGGTPDEVHDGTDNAYWTATAISGTWVFNSTDQANTGTRSIDATATTNSQQALLTRGSTIDLSGYNAVSGFIYITAWDARGTKDVRWAFRNGGVDASIAVDISPYINTGTLNTWQAFSIPMSAFNLINNIVDELVITTIDSGAGAAPDYYLDDIQLEQTAGGGSVQYKIGPEPGEIWEVVNLSWVFADNITGTLTDGTMPALAYNQILGVSSLTTGITIQRIQFGEVRFSAVVKDLLEIIGLASPTDVISGSDGVNTWVRITKNFPEPFVLNGDNEDKVVITVNDNLSGLLRFRMTSNIKVYIEVL